MNNSTVYIIMSELVIHQQIEQLKHSEFVSNIVRIREGIYQMQYHPKNLEHELFQESPYSEAYQIQLIIPQGYPQLPPQIQFIDKIYHLNIDPVSGSVHIPILGIDWCPFLNLKSIFLCLDSILSEPEEDFAVNQQMKLQYLHQREIYEQKRWNFCKTYQTQLPMQHLKESVIDVSQPNLKDSYDNIFENKKSTKIKADNMLIQNEQEQVKTSRFHQFKIEPQHTDHQVIGQMPNKQIQNIQILDRQSKTLFGQNLRKSVSLVQKGDFNQVRQSIIKADEFIIVMARECQNTESNFKSMTNPRLKSIIQTKISNQVKMLEEIIDMSSLLKQMIFKDLRDKSLRYLKLFG